MRLPRALIAAALLGAAHADVTKRQNDGSSSSVAPPADPSSSSAGDSSSTGGGDTPTPSEGGDTTVTRTTTVTNEDADTITRTTTDLTTSTKTVTAVHTEISTTTITRSDQDTATKTVYEQSTTFVNEKRDLDDLAPRADGPADALAHITAAFPVPTAAVDEDEEQGEAKRDAILAKRATVTDFETVTVGGEGDASTVFTTAHSTAVSTTSIDSTSVSVVTQTDQVGASTTTTVTSTIVVTTTSVSTGVSEPTAGAGDTAGGDSSDDSSGLSTGAKAGIGVGAGVGGLLVLGLLAWFILRRRRSGPKPDHDEMMGHSEVPVGGPGPGPSGGSRHTPQTSQRSSNAAAFLAPHRSPPQKAASPEGYRGTAMGDGRAGYAKPEPYGAAYAQPGNRSSTLGSSGGTNPTSGAAGGADHLPEHPMPAEMGGDTAAATRASQPSPQAAELGSGERGGGGLRVTNAAEMDSQPVSPATANTQTPPPQQADVYEMPAQSYR